MPTCVESFTPQPLSYGGCLPCADLPRSASELSITVADSACLACLIKSRQPFLVGRPGMGAPEEVACAIATRQQPWNDSDSRERAFWSKEQYLLKTLNGVETTSRDDVRTYARCYAASINRSDLVVRLGGGRQMPLRRPFTACTKTGFKHHHKTDVLLSQSGHFDAGRVLSHYVLNPWMLVADPAASRASMAQTSAAFAWLHALKGRTVLIVHPFANSITVQLAKGPDALWGAYARDVMPSGIDFKVVAPPQNLAKAKESSDWRQALDTLVARVDAAGSFDLALIACGGLGMLLGAYLRSSNRSAMYNGADLQIWFGVFGRRWGLGLGSLNLSFVKAWKRPGAAEVPTGALLVEGGAYW